MYSVFMDKDHVWKCAFTAMFSVILSVILVKFLGSKLCGSLFVFSKSIFNSFWGIKYATV